MTGVAFVLPSGGSTGAVQVGVLCSLLERGVVPDLLVGTSVGALNAAFMSADPTLARARELGRVWSRLTRADVFGRNGYGQVARLLRRQSHIYTPAALRTLIARFCPLEQLDGGAVPLQVATTDLDLGVVRWWSRGPAREILYASACLPGLLPPAVLDGHRHVDGGVLEPCPVQRAVDLDAATVYVLGEVPSLDFRPGRRLTALDVLIRSFTISRYSRLPEPAALARPGQRVIVVPGADVSSVGITDFSGTHRLIHESRRISAGFLDGPALSRFDEPAAPRRPPRAISAASGGTEAWPP